MTIADLDDTVMALEDAGSSPGAAAYRSLAHAARAWAANHGIELSSPVRHLEHEAPTPGLSLGIDL